MSILNRSASQVSCLMVLILAALYASIPANCAADEDWPRQIDDDRATVVIYQPQVEVFDGNKLECRAAVSVTPTGQTTPVFGAVWMMARVSTDYDERIVKLLDLEVTNAKFPDATQEQIEALSELLEAAIPEWDLDISLDRLLAGLEATEMERAQVERINTEPPRIYYRTTPTVLVMIDGDPLMQDVPDSKLKYVANTPFFIVQDPNSKTFYLKGGEYWYKTKEVTGEWENTDRVPKDIEELAEKSKPEGDDPDTSYTDGPPAILVATEPSELIQTDGEPDYVSVEGTQLLYMSNTESDVIMDIASQTYYVLIAGRWYSSKDLASGPWTYMPHDQLPEDFPSIPEESDIGNVLVSVPGTKQAQDAVLENQIPQTAEVDRKTASVKVQYDGDPEFEKCGDEGVAYAKNADKNVLLINDRFYCCDEAVWFESDKPDGPWEVSTEVPDEVQSIPPECPAYNVKYVYIYESTPEVVYVGYTPGYTCSYVYGGVVVYGTGYWYRPWYRYYYYPRPVTYGFSVHYNPYTGWGFSFGFHYGWVGYGWYRPYYGGWWGPAGYRAGYRHGYHAGYRHGYYHGARAGYAAGRRASTYPTNRNIYRNRDTGIRNTGVARPSTMPATSPGTRPSTSPATRPSTSPSTRPSTGAQTRPQPAPNINNNVYTDRNGNVYRQTSQGWETRDRGSWTPSNSASQQKRQSYQNNRSDLNRQATARNHGTQRTNNYESYQRSAQQPATQRPSTSGGRSGGGRRR